MAQGVVLERRGGIAQGLELGQARRRLGALLLKAGLGAAQGLLQVRIGHGAMRVVLEGQRGRLHQPGAAIGGAVELAGQDLGHMPGLDPEPGA